LLKFIIYFFREQLDIKSKEISNTRDRVIQLEHNIHNNNKAPDFYNKRNEYCTIFDDKKILEKKLHRGEDPTGLVMPSFNGFSSYNKGNNHTPGQFQDLKNNEHNFIGYNSNNNSTPNKREFITQQYNPTTHRTPVKTNVLPTTSSTYGAYYSHSELNNNRNIYY
jgi:hypothetical protein